ncbi:MAG TPA: hypothetical protein IAC14_08840 [Candidatus Scybalomonas excrementigallinarum]|nr:hypothetical protein [Candidatus Scybalomonas excrementigallinarum]
MNEEITLNDYILTNIDLETGYFTIRLKDNKEYIVYYKKSNGKTINYIEKDNKQIPLSEEVLKIHLEEIKTYQKSGI